MSSELPYGSFYPITASTVASSTLELRLTPSDKLSSPHRTSHHIDTPPIVLPTLAPLTIADTQLSSCRGFPHHGHTVQQELRERGTQSYRTSSDPIINGLAFLASLASLPKNWRCRQILRGVYAVCKNKTVSENTETEPDDIDPNSTNPTKQLTKTPHTPLNPKTATNEAEGGSIEAENVNVMELTTKSMKKMQIKQTLTLTFSPQIPQQKAWNRRQKL